MCREQLSGTEGQEQRTSLLQQIREALLADPRVSLAEEILHSPYGHWTEAVDIIVAPVKPIYDANELNEFMDSLVPEMPWSVRDEARKYDEKSSILHFLLGRLHFDETLGATKREIKVTTTSLESEALERAGVQIGESHDIQEELLQRRIRVRVYPDTTSGQLVAEYERGIKEGTIEYNSTLDYMKYWFTAGQFEIMQGAGNRPRVELLKLLRRGE